MVSPPVRSTTAVVDAELLRLLLRKPPLQDDAAWATALGVQEQDPVMASSITRRLNDVIPHLPEYFTADAGLHALLRFCQAAFPAELDGLVLEWVRSGVARYSLAFRTWLLFNWVECTHLPGLLKRQSTIDERWQWHETLMVAAVNETEVSVRRVLLLMLEELGSVMSLDDIDLNSSSDEQHTDSKCSAHIEDDQICSSSMTVEAFLDFCWLHADELATSAMLCAVKLRRLAVDQAKGPGSKLLDEQHVVTRIRWAVLTRPILFKPMMQYLSTFDALASQANADSSFLVLPSDALQRIAGNITATTLGEFNTTMDRLTAAFSSGAAHLRSDAFGNGMFVTKSDRDIGQCSPAERLHLLQVLDQDLDEAPAHLFPYVLLAFSSLLSSVAHCDDDASDKDTFLKDATKLVFDLFDRCDSDDDTTNCLQILAVILELKIARYAVWNQHSELYLEVCESLWMTSATELNPKTRWIKTMALQQLVLESDVHVLERNLTGLSAFFPERLLRLARVRAGIKVDPVSAVES